jgi:uncharacterized protein (DUF1778 family)
MPATRRNDARLDFRLPIEAKKLIERAADRSMQTVSDFAVSHLLKSAREVLQGSNVGTAGQRTPEERLHALRTWLNAPRPPVPAGYDPDKTWDRDTIYDFEG